MFDKRLMNLCPESRKYIVGNIVMQWLELRTCLHKRMRMSFRQILPKPKTALKILAGRQARLRIFALS